MLVTQTINSGILAKPAIDHPAPASPVAAPEEKPTTIADVFQSVAKEAAAPLLYVDSYKPNAKIAVLDSFKSEGESNPRHGDHVAAIIAKQGFDSDDIQKVDHTTWGMTNELRSNLLYQDGPEPFSWRMDAYVELGAGALLAKTNGTLAKILADPESPITTINQSQGSSRIDAYDLLNSAAIYRNDEKVEQVGTIGAKIAETLGINHEAPGFTIKQLRQGMVDHVGKIIEGSVFVKEQLAAHAAMIERLRDRGVTFVTSAGNNADELTNYREQGLQVPKEFDDDITSVGRKFVVGALDDKGTADRSDDSIAFFSSLYPGVNLLAPGVGVLGEGERKVTGTSFASPLVAGTIAKVKEQHPDWSLDQVEDEARARFTPTDGYNILS